MRASTRRARVTAMTAGACCPDFVAVTTKDLAACLWPCVAVGRILAKT